MEENKVESEAGYWVTRRRGKGKGGRAEVSDQSVIIVFGVKPHHLRS